MKWKTLFAVPALGSLCVGFFLSQSVAQGKQAASPVGVARPPLVVLTSISAPLTPQTQAARNTTPATINTGFFPASPGLEPPLVQLPFGSVAPAWGIVPHPTPLPALNSPDIDMHHRDLAWELFSVLPPQCAGQLQAFYLTDMQGDERGFAGKGVVMMSRQIASDAEFLELGGHEILGHFFGLTCFANDTTSGVTAFRDGDIPVASDNPTAAFYAISWADNTTPVAGAKPSAFVSRYARQAGPFEDFAESAAYYAFHQQEFRVRAKKDRALAAKLAWFDTYFPHHEPLGIGGKWDGTIPWDVTKLSYRWVGTEKL